MKVKHQLLITHGILVMLALMIVLINIFSYTRMENDAALINQSGRMRAYSYNMGLLANRISQETDTVQKVALKSDLKSKLTNFESSLNELMLSDSNLLKDEDVKAKLIYISKMWETSFRSKYMSMITEDSNTEICDQINSEIDLFVEDVNHFVNLISDDAQQKVVVAIYMNAALVLLIVSVTLYSFHSTNKHVRKPMMTLIKELKALSLIDDEVSDKLKNIDISEFKEMSLYFNELMFDQLTKVYTRKSGLAKLSKLVGQDNRRKLHFSLCFIDINGLKMVNDILGHNYGDELIVSAIDVIKNEIREDDYVIRMGGDEFLIVFSNINSQIAETIWERINARYEEINVTEDKPFLISVSHGIVEYEHVNRSRIDDLIKRADDKMYVEKKYLKEAVKINVIK